jgi:hypothetical protein
MYAYHARRANRASLVALAGLVVAVGEVLGLLTLWAMGLLNAA